MVYVPVLYVPVLYVPVLYVIQVHQSVVVSLLEKNTGLIKENQENCLSMLITLIMIREPPRLSLEIWNVCDDILIDEPTINNQTERWFRSFTADCSLEYRLQEVRFRS